VTVTDRSRPTYDRVLNEAARLFAIRGYQRTRIQDVAAAVGVSEPAVYRYFRGKDALFDSVLRRAAGDHETVDSPRELPVPNPLPGETEAYLFEFFRRARRLPALESFIVAPPCPPEALREQLTAVADEVFELAVRYRVGARIMQASAIESPELGLLYEREVTTPIAARLGTYLERATASGLCLPADPTSSGALMINLIGVHAAYDDLLVTVGASLCERKQRVTAAALAMFRPIGGYV